MITNIHLYPSTFVAETRILKETRSLLNLGLVDRVILLGIHEGELADKEEHWPGIEIRRLRLKLKNSSNKWIRYFSFFEFLIRAYRHVGKQKVNVINVHSIHVLLIGVWLKQKMHCKLVYDTHELETEVTGSTGVLRFLSKKLECYCMRYIDELIVVSNSIASWYKDAYDFPHITAIYNVPMRPNNVLLRMAPGGLRAYIGVSLDTTLFIYQGLLTQARGVDDILEAFCGIKDECHVVFMGSGPLKDIILQAAKEYHNVHYHPQVPPDQVLKFTMEADAGIHIIKNTCLNHYFCLPNKIFEYLMSGIPFIVSDFPEMANVVADTGGGWICKPDSKGLREIISHITREEISQKRASIQKNLHKYGWHLEELKYIPIYKRLLTNA